MSLFKGVDICRAVISAVHKIPHDSSFIMKDPAHVLHYRTIQRYKGIRRGTIDREKEGLWLIVGSNSVHRTRVVRSWAKRRIYSAIVKQLRAHGFDANGRKVKGAKDQIMHDGHEIGSLLGSVNVFVLERSIDYKYKELLRQAGLLVRNILTRCGQSKGSP